MSTTSLTKRAVSALTLLSFTITTISPSLAWAVEREEARAEPGARVVDEVPTQELAASRTKADVAVDPSETVAGTVSKEKPPVDELKDAVGGQIKTAPGSTAEVETGGDTVAALPTGGDKSGVTSQSISVPKGSGTIQGMGESFSAQLSTGIATFSVPFALPAARGGAQPSLGLSYSSGSGSGLAGMGWSVGVPFIARQTDRGLPGYDDRADWHPNQDRFVFNGGQELVPICTVTDNFVCTGAITGEVMPPWSANHQYFRPRVEGSFLRFFWSPNHKTWRVQDKSGVTMELGEPLDGSGSDAALETDPDDATRIFRWHLVRQYDAYGTANPAVGNPAPFNVVVYKFSQNGGQAYLSDIYDTTPSSTPATTTVSTYAHHTHLEYDDRSDPTESYRSGWLIKQAKRLARVDVTSKTYSDGPSSARRQVRRYYLKYDALFHTSYLTSVQVEGRCDGTEAGAPSETNELLGATNCGLLPPMTFDYSHVKGFNTSGSAVGAGLAGYEAFDGRIQQVGASPPHSIDEELSDYFDINADGLPDVLVTAPGVYGNDYGVFFNSAGGIRNTFGSVAQLGVSGVLGANSGTIKLSNANVAPLDLDADGIIDFLHMPKVKTYAVYRPRLVGNKWMLVGSAINTASQQSPKVDLGKDAAETRVVDVNFDGMVDLVVSTGTQFQTFLSLGRLPNGDSQFGHGSWASASSSNISNEPIAKCVPYSGSPVRFSDSEIQLADMNGDGIQDIVRLRRGDLRYWPGRGNGFWGTGPLDDCPGGTFSDKRYLTMDSAPFYSDIQGTSLRMDDVNGDGLDDLVQVRFDAVDVWLNVDGKGWTQRYILDGTTASPAFANRVRLMDINGSGTRDIVWGNGKKYEFIDLAGGERPGVLIQVKNGLGKSTDIEYQSSTEEMLAAERTGADCNGAVGTFANKWCSKMPTVTHLVKRVTESDNLSVAGSGKSQYVTEYSYRDPVYEGRQREFRGFRKARSKRLGDENSPTDFTESTFLLGECEDETPNNGVDDCAVSERWRDNPKEALKGLPIVTERFDEAGKYLSTDASTYRLRQLYTGRDGRFVRHAFESGKRTILYDTAGSFADQPSCDLPLVEDQLTQPSSLTPSIATEQCASLTADTLDGTHAYAVPLRAASGYAVTTSGARVDGAGNRLIAVSYGHVAGDACAAPGAIASNPDEAICSFTVPERVPSDPTSWLYRTTVAWSQGSSDTVVRGKTTTSYSKEGAPTGSSALLSGTIGLERSVTPPTPAPAPTSKSADGTISLGTRSYDDFGNLFRETGPNGRCRDIGYEGALGTHLGYAQLPTLEVTYVNGCPPPGPTPSSALTTSADYDRGLNLVTLVIDMTLQSSTVHYDEFGRLTELFKPRPETVSPPDNTVPAVKISYDLPPPGSTRGYSIIHTQTQDGTTPDATDYLQSYSYVDGMGRARVGLAEGDPTADQDGVGNNFIVSSIAEFDAKGAVRRKYLPFFDDPDPALFPVSDAPPNTQYGRQRYDAFGRQIQTFDVDGTVTLQSRYHALDTDLYDAADLYPGPQEGSYATTRSDGHGRTIATVERVHVNNAGVGSLEQHEVQTKYLAGGQPQVIKRINLATQQKVVRWMAYDSLGRMVMNVDPHATVGFNETPSTVAGLKTWHYVYDDAGDLVGTSDARGCGQNFVYDGAGRLKAEDYSPCVSGQPNWSTPNLTTGASYEVFYEYDNAPSTIVTKPTGYDDTSLMLRGHLKAVHDRAATTWFAYDGRGRSVTTYRRVSYIGAPQATVAGRYVDTHWFKKDFAYDAADRPVAETTGATSSELQATNLTGDHSSVMTHYTARGTLRDVDSSYGKLVSNIKRSAEGLVQSMTLGDAAGTQTAMSYDSRRRLRSVQTFRQEANLWSTAPPAVSIAPVPGVSDKTRQLLLEDLDYSYDVVGNPTEIRDWRTPEVWPDGAQPVTRRMEYDDLYRVTRVDYEYPRGTDKFTSPYAAEIAGIAADPRRPIPPGQRLLDKRPLWQTFKFDWLGNTTRTDDDQHAFWDRSLGDITNNDSSGLHPYRFMAGVQPGTSSQHSGSLTSSNTIYDAAGNLTSLQLARSTADCASGLAVCNSRYFYAWDEVGRLTNATRTEGSGPSSTGPLVDYLYDANDERVVKQAYARVGNSTTLTPTSTTLYVFDSLEVRRSPLSATKQYTVDTTTEVAYLSANGMRLARLHYEPAAKGEPRLSTNATDLHAPNLHVLLNLPDHLGSSSLIIDHASGELVEARTYQPYGATESDYRPDRWKGFREDYGFTGKEEDVEVGLQYFGKRYLSPYLGRWISADPLAVHAPGEADLNVYSYVSGQLLKDVDPVGLEPTEASGNNQITFDGKVVSLEDPKPSAAPPQPQAKATADAPPPRAKARPAPTTATQLPSHADFPDDPSGGHSASPTDLMQQVSPPDPIQSGEASAPPAGDPCGGGGNTCHEGSTPKASSQAGGGGSDGRAKSPKPDVVSGAGEPPRRTTVRRFMSRAELKQLKKTGLQFDPVRGNGIPATTRNFTPKNQGMARELTGAPSAEYQVDLDVTGVPQGPAKATKARIPEYSIRGNITRDMIMKVTKVPK